MLTHRITKTLLAGILIAAAAPSAAAEPASPPPAKAKKQTKQVNNEKGNGLICKKVRMTGTRLAQETCASAAEWKELEGEGFAN